jgi:surface polysaccharide O-acyltransferase-like enzyme
VVGKFLTKSTSLELTAPVIKIQRSHIMRNAGIDLFRFISIIAVLTIHIKPYGHSIYGHIINQLSRFAVPFFFLISGYLFYEKTTNNRSNALVYSFRNGYRLFYIYLFWYVIYIFWPIFTPVNWASILQNGVFYELYKETLQFMKEAEGHILYYIAGGGRGYHLWFLPSLGVAILLLGISIRYNLFLWGTTISIVLFIFALLIRPYKNTSLGLPFGFDPRNGPFFSSVFVFIGAILSKYRSKFSLQHAIVLTIIGFSVHMGEIFFLKNEYGVALTSHDFVFGTVLYGTGVAMIAIAIQDFKFSYRYISLGKLTLGIYVLHVLVIEVLKSINIWPTIDLLKVIICLFTSIILVNIIYDLPILNKIIK